MPYRALPNTHVTRLNAMVAASNKWDSYNDDPQKDSKRAITGPVHDRLVALQPGYQAANNAFASTLAAQGVGTKLVETNFTTLGLIASHFIQVFNFAVLRQKFPAAHRAYYKLTIGNDQLPDLSTQTDILTVAGNLLTGEAKRLADNPGALPMANPAISEIADALAAVNVASEAQIPLVQAHNDAIDALGALEAPADALVLDLWDDVENFFRHDDPSTLRRHAREWGLVYASRPGDPPDPTPTDPPVNPIPGP